MKIFFLLKLKNIKRYQEIIAVLSKHGFGYILEALNLKNNFFPLKKRKNSTQLKSNPAERLRYVLEELGPTFIKLGQILSTRSDLLTRMYIQQLEQLQDKVTPESFDKLRTVIESNINQPLLKIFQTVDTTPLAVASIGQVHRGRLHSGETVIIKIQRPGVKRIIETDLEILTAVATFLEKRTQWGKQYQLTHLLAEFSRSIREELDYTTEAANATRLRDNFMESTQVIIPEVFWSYTTPEILVMEYWDGIKITAPEINKEFDKKKLAVSLINVVLKQILDDGFFHADLHPGNILITTSGKIILIDFGMMGRIDAWTRDRLSALLLKIVQKDVKGIVNVMVELDYTPASVDKKGLSRELFYMLDKYSSRSLNQLKAGEIFRELMRVSLNYRISLPRDLFLVARSLIILESNIERLDPELNWIKLARPFGERLIKQKLSPEHLLDTSRNYLNDLSELIVKLPDALQNTLSKLEDGKLQLTMEHRHFDKFITQLNLIGNRLSFSLIIASIIVGTSLFAEKMNYSFIRRFSIAEIGFIIAVIMGVWLLVSIIKSGRI